MNNRITLAVLVAVTIGATALSAQTTADLTGDALIRALIDEIRTFRVAMQKSSAYELRGRLLIDRAKLHQETIRELAREVENSADFMRQPEPADIAFEMEAEMEARTAGIANPEERRKMIERQKEALERRKEMEARHREQMRMRFQRMENRLAEERDKLKAVEDELAEIQRELASATR
jgi:hypothetical protein